MSTLRSGSSGPEVARLQRELNRELPPGQHVKVDGEYGPRTEAAVKSYQKHHGLEPDGVAGPRTQAALDKGHKPDPHPPHKDPQPKDPKPRPKPKEPEPEPEPTKGDAAPRLISIEDLRKIMTRLKLARAKQMIDPLNRAMAEFHIDTRLRISAFIAQIAHESQEFLYMEEIASGRAYDITVNPRKARELGNLHKGDGPRYKGRGPIQLTGRSNYRAAGKSLKIDLEGTPTIASQPSVAFRVAGWYWKSRKLNGLADAGNFWDLTYRINSARLHYKERKRYYELALVVLR